jgi:hypothetical protein
MMNGSWPAYSILSLAGEAPAKAEEKGWNTK